MLDTNANAIALDHANRQLTARVTLANGVSIEAPTINAALDMVPAWAKAFGF